MEEEIKKLDQPVDFGSDSDHGDEETDETEEWENRMSQIYALKERLSEIELELFRLK